MKRAKVTEARQQAAIAEKKTLLRNVDEADGLKLHPLAWGKSGPLVRAEGLSLSYGGRTVCAGLTFTLRPGERMAVTGPNGCGKSTLLKKLCGQDVAACGTLALGAGLIVSYVPQDASFLHGGARDYARNAGVDETMFLTLLRKLGFERVQFEKDMTDYSAGQKKKVLLALSRAASSEKIARSSPSLRRNVKNSVTSAPSRRASCVSSPFRNAGSCGTADTTSPGAVASVPVRSTGTPQTAFSSVLFPHPLGPVSARRRPARRQKSARHTGRPS